MKLFANDSPAAAAGDDLETLRIANDADLGALADGGALRRAARIELEFPTFTDGRAFSQAVLLRRRYRFGGDLRATGDVLVDLLVHMQRSGFSSAVLAEGVNADAAQRQFDRYAAYYQGDVCEPRPHFVREEVARMSRERGAARSGDRSERTRDSGRPAERVDALPYLGGRA